MSTTTPIRTSVRTRFAGNPALDARSDPPASLAASGQAASIPGPVRGPAGRRLQRFAEVRDFLDSAGAFLAAREAEHNLILGICSNLIEMPETSAGPPYLAVVSAGDAVVGVAMQTPPRRLVLSEIDDPEAIPMLVADTLDRDLPAVMGPVEHVRAFVEVWTSRGGPAAHLEGSERIFRLTAVRPPRPVGGGPRAAVAGDRALVAAWIEAFMREAIGDVDLAEVAASTDRWLAGRGRTLYLWDDGAAVSLAGVGGPTPNGIRIGPVYTPPESRGRGYASALVAAVSQAELDAGRRFCFLFTDQANATSNHIYQVIGYQPVRDVDVYEFERG